MTWFLRAMAAVYFVAATFDIVTSEPATADLAMCLALMLAARQEQSTEERR